MAVTKVTEKEMAPTKTVDANGWTIVDFGTVKLYSKTVTFEAGSIASGAFLSVGSFTNPVGETNTSINRVHSIMITGNSPFITTHLENETEIGRAHV